MFDKERHHFTDVIKNESSGNLLFCRYPVEDFNTNSTLVVMPGEQAVFVKSGVVQQVFENGTYILSTENYPFITRIRNVLSGGVSTFSCVVYFFRKAQSAEILWGTSTPIQVRDKLLGIATQIRGHGSYKIQIVNPELFLSKLVGNNTQYQTNEDLNAYFSNQFQSKIKSVITTALNDSDEELLGIDSHLDAFGSEITPFMDEVLKEYGLTCIRFTIAGLDIEDSELRKKYDEIGMDAIAKLKNANADKAVMQTLGDDWGKQKAADILTNMSTNSGTAGIGGQLAMGIAGGAAMADMANKLLASVQEQHSSAPANSPEQKLALLKKMFEENLITQEEYESKKKEILNDF